MKTVDQIVSSINMITNVDKRLGVLGNFSSILAAATGLQTQKNEGIIQMSEESFKLRQKLVLLLQSHSADYTDLKGRDLCDVVRTIVNLKKLNQNSEEAQKFCDKHLRILAKRSAL